MSRVDTKIESHLERLDLESNEILDALELMKQIVSSCRGPYGNNKMIQNSVGGHLTLTSTSSRFLNAMSFSNPILKLIVSSAQSHLKCYQDGGNLLMLISLNIIVESVKLHVSKKILTELYEIFLGICLEYLGSLESSNIQVNVAVSDLKQMSSVVKSILVSKPLLKLTKKSVKFCNSLILETFLRSLSDTNTVNRFSDGVSMVLLEGESVEKSAIFQGLLIQCPEIVSYSKQTLETKVVKNSKDGNYILVAIVTISMSGDTEETGTMQFESDSSVDTENFFLNELKEFCNKLASENVGVLLCQKVVHPRLKRHLRDLGLVVIERLGLLMISYAQDVTGAVPIKSFQNVSPHYFGKLSGLEHQIIQDKSYLHLVPLPDNCVVTLVLYSPEGEQLAELKSVYSTCLLTLKQLVHAPKVLMGGGCWQVHMASVVRNKVKEKQTELINKIGCTISTQMQACEVFSKTLEKVAMVTSHDGEDHLLDCDYGHFWRISKGDNLDPDTSLQCSCGRIQQKISDLNFISESRNLFTAFRPSTGCGNKNEHSVKDFGWDHTNMIYDFSESCIAALTSGVMTANTVLSIGQFIQDTN